VILLSNILEEEFIQLNVRVDNWEEAIRKGTLPLVMKNKITKEYVNKIIEIAKTIGPYIVITKHVALPHAPAEFGAKETAIGITTLEYPVRFGNEANDPVKYLFCLSATDSNSHLEALAELVKLLENEEFFQLLDTSSSPKEIFSYISKI
jgi:mannitol/fructose-specific phosphotransferase system IIA component (Ntr-type)